MSKSKAKTLERKKQREAKAASRQEAQAPDLRITIAVQAFRTVHDKLIRELERNCARSWSTPEKEVD
jgi:hypothetical protein